MRGVNAADIALNQGRHDAVLFTLEQEHVTTSEIPDAQHQSLHRAPRGKVLGNYFLFPRLDKTDQRAPAWIYLPEQLCRGHAVGWCGSMRLSADTHELAKRGQAYNMLHHALIEYAKDNGYSRLAGWVLTEPAKHCNQRALNAHLKRGWQLSEFRSTHRVETSPGVFEKLGYTFVYYDLPRTEKTTQQIETIGRHIAAEVFNKTPFFEVCAGLSGTIMARTLAQWTLGAAGLAMVEVGLASLATLGGLLGIRLSSRRASSLSSNSYKATKRFKQTLTIGRTCVFLGASALLNLAINNGIGAGTFGNGLFRMSCAALAIGLGWHIFRRARAGFREISYRGRKSVQETKN